MQVAEETRWNTSAGPTLRAQSATWQWLGPTTLPQAISHTNALLREFALGGEATHDAALDLLGHIAGEFAALLEGDIQVSRTIPCSISFVHLAVSDMTATDQGNHSREKYLLKHLY